MEFPPETVSRRRHTGTLLLLAALVVAAYGDSFTAGFTLDNGPRILGDARVHAVTLQNLKDILLHGYWWPGIESGLYRPLTTLTFLANYVVPGGGSHPFGYHALNLLLHIANAFLVYLLVWTLARRYWPAVFAAVLWGLHPVATEAVTNMVGRADELAALGVLAGLLCYIRSTGETGKRKTRWLTAMMCAAAVAVFSKENGVMLAVLVPLYDLTYRIPRGSSAREAWARFRQFFWDGYTDLAIPIAAMLAARWTVLRHSGVTELPFLDNPLLGADVLTRWATAIRVTGKYLWLLVWPQKLSIDYSYNQVPLLTWQSATWRDAAAAAAIVALVLAGALLYRRRPTGFFLIAFAGLTLLPVSNLLVNTGTLMGERLLYLPSVGFAAAAALAIFELARRLRLRPAVAGVALCGIGLAYGVRTWDRNSDWHDNLTLFASAVEAAPASFKTHMGLANALAARDLEFNAPESAIAEAEKALAIVRDLPDRRIATTVFVLLAALYWGRGDSLAHKDPDGNPLTGDGNVEWYRKALAVALRGEQVDRAQNESHREAELARGTPPDRVGLVGIPDEYMNLGMVYLRLGDPQKATDAFLYERRLDPRGPMPYQSLAFAALARNQAEAAATLLLEALLLRENPETMARLAQVYGRIEGGNCAVAGGAVNRECPIVRRDLCSAYTDLEAVFRQGKLDDLALRVAAASAREGVCR